MLCFCVSYFLFWRNFVFSIFVPRNNNLSQQVFCIFKIKLCRQHAYGSERLGIEFAEQCSGRHCCIWARVLENPYCRKRDVVSQRRSYANKKLRTCEITKKEDNRTDDNGKNIVLLWPPYFLCVKSKRFLIH